MMAPQEVRRPALSGSASAGAVAAKPEEAKVEDASDALCKVDEKLSEELFD